MNIGQLTIDMAANVARLQKDMEAGRRTVDKATASMAKAAKQAKDAITGIAAGLTVKAFADKLVAVQRQFDVLNSALVTITGSSAKAAKEFQWIKKFAAETPFALTEVTGAFIKMKSLGLDASQKALTSYGNTASAMGKNLNQFIEAVADAATGEFERLKEFGIKAKKQGDDVSLTFQGVTTTIKNNATEITGYLQALGENQFAGAMAERAKTLDGAISNLGDTWDELFRTVNENGAGTLIHDSVKAATGALSDAITMMKALNEATKTGTRDSGAFASIQNGLAIAMEAVAVAAINIKYTLVQTGRTLGGLAALYKEFFTGNFAGAKAIGEAMVADSRTARAEVDAQSNAILNARRLRDIAATGEGQDEPRFRRLLAAQTEATVASITTTTTAKTKAETEAAKAAKKALADKLKNDEDYYARIQDFEEARIDYVLAKEKKAASDKAKRDEDYYKMLQDFEEARIEYVKDKEAERAAAQKKVYEEQAKQQEKLADELSGALTNALMEGFGSGKGFMQNLGESITNMFKTWVARMIADAIKNAILSAMASTQWGQLISGALGGAGGGAGGGGGLISTAVSAYKAYTGATGAAGAAGGGGAAAGAAGAGGAVAATGTGTAAVAPVATQAAAPAAASTGWAAYAGYAAWIAVAIMIADKMYSVGYNRTALGEKSTKAGDNNSTAQYTYGHGNTTTGQSGARNWSYNSPGMIMTKDTRKLLDALGMSEKWADIFSGTTRMATLVGRRLKAYGLQANINGGGVDVKGYEFYKGGLFRGNKTTTKDVDPRDVEAVRGMVETVRQSAKSMAAAMGHSGEAIDNFTGQLKINFKGAKDAAEMNKRVSDAMDELKRSMLNAIPGMQMSKEKFKEFMEGVRGEIEKAGMSSASIADILIQGMTGRMNEAQVGEALASQILGGIYNTIASPFAAQIANAFSAQIIEPIMVAALAGVPVSQAVTQQAIQGVIATANNAANALNAIFADSGFRAAMNGVMTAIRGISSAVVRPSRSLPRFSSAVKATSTAAEDAARAARELRDAWKEVTNSLLEEIKRIKGEVIGEGKQGVAYYQAQLAIKGAQARAGNIDAAKEIPELSQRMLELARLNAGSMFELRRMEQTTMGQLESLRQFIGKKYGIALPGFAVGTNYVNEDMAAVLHQGEAVLPKAYNPENGTAMTVADVSTVFEKYLDQMRLLVTATQTVAVNTGGTKRLLDRVVEQDYIRTKESV